MKHFKNYDIIYMKWEWEAFLIVIGLYPIEITKSRRKGGGIAPTALQ